MTQILHSAAQIATAEEKVVDVVVENKEQEMRRPLAMERSTNKTVEHVATKYPSASGRLLALVSLPGV